MGDTVVYQWIRKDGSPYYIGIGNPKRPYTGRRGCGSPPPRERIVILHEDLEWEEACEIEKELIAFYGRKDVGTGILRNLTDGGDGILGYKHTDEEKKRRSKASMGKNNPYYGKKHSEETKRKMSERFSGKNNPNYGKKRPKETREKISKAKRGQKPSEEARRKMSESKKGKNNYNYGKNLPEEVKKKLSEMNSGEKHARYTPRNWYHSTNGEVLQKSISDLVKMFPEQNLIGTCLSAVALGKRSHHKEWKILEVN